MKIPPTHGDYAGRERRKHRADDLRSRLLKRLAHVADTEVQRARARRRNLEAIIGKIDIVGWIALPDRQDDVDRLGKDLVAVFVEDTEGFRVGRERSRTDAEYESALREMIEHRRLHGGEHRMLLRDIGGASGELDLSCLRDQRREKHHAARHVLATIGEMLAD